MPLAQLREQLAGFARPFAAAVLAGLLLLVPGLLMPGTATRVHRLLPDRRARGLAVVADRWRCRAGAPHGADGAAATGIAGALPGAAWRAIERSADVAYSASADRPSSLNATAASFPTAFDRRPPDRPVVRQPRRLVNLLSIAIYGAVMVTYDPRLTAIVVAFALHQFVAAAVDGALGCPTRIGARCRKRDACRQCSAGLRQYRQLSRQRHRGSVLPALGRRACQGGERRADDVLLAAPADEPADDAHFGCRGRIVLFGGFARDGRHHHRSACWSRSRR